MEQKVDTSPVLHTLHTPAPSGQEGDRQPAACLGVPHTTSSNLERCVRKADTVTTQRSSLHSCFVTSSSVHFKKKTWRALLGHLKTSTPPSAARPAAGTAFPLAMVSTPPRSPGPWNQLGSFSLLSPHVSPAISWISQRIKTEPRIYNIHSFNKYLLRPYHVPGKPSLVCTKQFLAHQGCAQLDIISQHRLQVHMSMWLRSGQWTVKSC